jgi:hypothetical protein
MVPPTPNAGSVIVYLPVPTASTLIADDEPSIVVLVNEYGEQDADVYKLKYVAETVREPLPHVNKLDNPEDIPAPAPMPAMVVVLFEAAHVNAAIVVEDLPMVNVPVPFRTTCIADMLYVPVLVKAKFLSVV